MEIGGIDLILEGPVTSDDLTVMYRLFQAHWPGLEVYKEEGTEGEWFACRDLDTYRQFLKGDPTGNDAVIHLLMSEDSVTLVVDPVWEKMGKDILAALANSRK